MIKVFFLSIFLPLVISAGAQENNQSYALKNDKILDSNINQFDTLQEELAEFYFDKADYSNALRVSLKILDSIETNSNKVDLDKWLFNVGRIHYFFRNEKSNDVCLPFLKKSLNEATLQGDTFYMLKSSRGIGVVYGEQNKMDSSFYFLERAKEFSLKIGVYDDASSIGCIIGHYMIISNMDTLQALELFKEAYQLAHKAKEKETLAYAAQKMGLGYTLINEFQKAKSYLNESEKIYKEIKSKDGQLNINNYKLMLYRKLNNKDSMIKILLNSAQINGEVYNEKLITSLADMQTKYETEKKEQENAILKQKTAIQNEIIKRKEAQEKTQFAIGIVLLILIGAVSSIIFFRIKLKQKSALAKEQELRYKSIIDTEEKERKRIAQELHDGLGQILSSAKMQISSLENKTLENKKVTNSMKLIDTAVTEVRTISHNLMPSALIKKGLIAALQDQIRIINESGIIEIHAFFPETIEIAESKSIALYRIIQEILNNAIKYSKANNLWMNMKVQNQKVKIVLRDDGIGFDKKSTKAQGIGLKNIASRIDMLGGSHILTTETNKGVKHSIELPI